MSKTRNAQYRPHKAAGHLLLLGCSKSKREVRSALPALELYDGVNFRVLRTFLNEFGWPAGLTIKVISAKYGLIDATDLIEFYDERLDVRTAKSLNKQVIKSLGAYGRPQTAFINLGKDYLPAVEGIDRLFRGRTVEYASGGIGQKMSHMKRWLHGLPRDIATVPRQSDGRSYLYFFPDWDDYIYRPFVHETEDSNGDTESQKLYAHEVFGAEDTPYDGILVSLAQLHTGKGTLSRLDPDNGNGTDLRKKMNVPNRLLMFGDCGAFSYASADEPPFTAARAAQLYERFGFDIGASVDHIPLPEITVRNDNGELVRKPLSAAARRKRMELTIDNAQKFLNAWKRHKYSFIPLGVIQGLDIASYVRCVHDYIDMGYQHVALGGLVPRHDNEIMAICCAVREAIQSRTRTRTQNVWLHLFGILRPKLQATFRLLGVSSFDNPRSRDYLQQPEVAQCLGAFIRIIDPQLTHIGGNLSASIRTLVQQWVAEYDALVPTHPQLAAFVSQGAQAISNKGIDERITPATPTILYRILSHAPFVGYQTMPDMDLRLSKLTRLFESFCSQYGRPLYTDATTAGEVRQGWLGGFYYGFCGYLEKKGIDDDEDEEVVCPTGFFPIMTIHQAKGLEFDFVFVGTLGASVSPSNSHHLEADMRPFRTTPPAVVHQIVDAQWHDDIRQHYVAYSRAKHALILVATNGQLQKTGTQSSSFGSQGGAWVRQNVPRL